MKLSFFKSTLLLLCVFICFSGISQTNKTSNNSSKETRVTLENSNQNTEPELADLDSILIGADQYSEYKSLLKNKKVAVVANQTSITKKNHLVDFLLQEGIAVQKVFAPEHGFRGKADAGEIVKDGRDTKTGLPIISLYGKNKKPSDEQIKNIDVMVFDIQDVGARFYTYISSLHYVMEACAEADIPLLILDRPNPNGHYIDGPILEAKHSSFVGMHPVPVVHGMTIGEYAQMINGEGWLKKGMKCNLSIIKMKNYSHQTEYSLPVSPSPNLPNDKAINLYPSLCFFEGTFVSVGRGTTAQFQVFGAPSFPERLYGFAFKPYSNEGAKNPKFKDELCWGKNLRSTPKLSALNLQWLIDAYVVNENKTPFFNDYFTKLAGTEILQKQIEAGMTQEEIKKTWKKGLKDYDSMRQPYLLYE